MHNTHILWKTIHCLSRRVPQPTLNTSITFNNKITTTPKDIANCFTKQFSNTVRHATVTGQTNPLTEQHRKYKDIILHSPQLSSWQGKHQAPKTHWTSWTRIPNTHTLHGYKTQHSSVTALHSLNNTIAKGFSQMASPVRTITVSLDMSKAFDRINIHTLIMKFIAITSKDARPTQHTETTHQYNVNLKLSFLKVGSSHTFQHLQCRVTTTHSTGSGHGLCR